MRTPPTSKTTASIDPGSIGSVTFISSASFPVIGVGSAGHRCTMSPPTRPKIYHDNCVLTPQ